VLTGAKAQVTPDLRLAEPELRPWRTACGPAVHYSTGPLTPHLTSQPPKEG
jgi:hypothetical protein